MENGIDDEEVPKYLYQYTSIETLALILKNRCIKFNSLKNVDDLEECKAGDIKDFGKFTFVSCWTDDEKENIALWHMYTEKMRGIRLKLSINCFKDDTDYIETKLSENKLRVINLPPKIMKFPGILKFRYYDTVKINYTDDPNELYPDVWKPEKDKDHPLFVNGLGSNKNTQWKFQREWRYIIYTNYENWLYPGEDISVGKKRIESFTNIPNGIFINLSDEAYKHMEIMLGPNTTESDEIIVESLIEKYNKTANIKHSSLKVRPKN